MISNCGSDERGQYHGGQAGDQTGNEWRIRKWYSRPWTCVLRYPDPSVRMMLASDADAAARNDNIGYDQWQRLTFWLELKKAKYIVENIKNKCETDCSAGVAALTKGVGYKKNIKGLKDIPEETVTWDMKESFRKAGFLVLTDKKYLESDEYLLPGDILLNEAHHVAINLDKGTKATYEIPVAAAEAFVTRLYEIALGRAPDPTGYRSWINDIVTGSKTGSEVARGFIFSNEFIGKQHTDDEFVSIMYRVFLNRKPDPIGYMNWIKVLASGQDGKEKTFIGFAQSNEFKKICAASRITP